MAFTPDSRVLASGGLGTDICLLDTYSGELARTIEQKCPVLTDLQFDKEAHELAACMYDPEAEVTRVQLHVTAEQHKSRMLKSTPHIASSLRFSPDSKMLVAAGGAKTNALISWNLKSPVTQVLAYGVDSSVLAIYWSTCGKYVQVYWSDKQSRCWDLKTGTKTIEPSVQFREVNHYKGLTIRGSAEAVYLEFSQRQKHKLRNLLKNHVDNMQWAYLDAWTNIRLVPWVTLLVTHYERH